MTGVTMVVLLGLAASTPLEDAREHLRRGRHAAALELVRSPALDAPALQTGLLAQAAAGAGESALAAAAYLQLRASPLLTPLARALVESRYEHVCGLTCDIQDVPVELVEKLPLDSVLDLLTARTRLQHPSALLLAKTAARLPSGTNRDMRAHVAAAIHDALLRFGEPADVRAHQAWVWQSLGAHPALDGVLRGFTDVDGLQMLGADGVAERATHLVDQDQYPAVIPLVAQVCGTDIVCAQLKSGRACELALMTGRAQTRVAPQATARTTLEAVANHCAKDRDVAPRALMLLARSLASGATPSTPQAIAVYEQVSRGYPNHRLADDALWEAARIADPADDRAAARVLFKRAAAVHGNGDMTARLGWFLFREHLKNGNTALLRAHVARLVALFKTRDAVQHRTAVYWSGRLAGLRGVMLKLVNEQPCSFEGMAARATLRGWKVPVPTQLPVLPLWTEPLPPQELDDFATASVQLAAVGLDDAAIQMVKKSALYRSPGKANPWIAHHLHALGDHRAAVEWTDVHGRAALTSLPTQRSMSVWRNAWPLAFPSEVQAAADAEKIPVTLLLGLIREESLFDPRAGSKAGAQGLTQVVPSTAAEDMKDPTLADGSSGRLMDPALNAQAGARHLRKKLGQFNGDKVWALAAFNAGPVVVRAWQAALPPNACLLYTSPSPRD